MVYFDLEAQVFDHAPDFWGGRAWCREVAVHEDGICRIEGQGLEAAEVMFAAACHTEFGPWVQEPEEAEYFQAALRSQVVTVLQRRACCRMERVQRNGVRLYVDQGHRQVDEVFVLFSHADDPA